MENAGVDEDFQRMWDETAAEYKRITNRDLRENVSLETGNIVATINEDKVSEKEKPKWKKAKTYLANSLKCVLTLGTIAAQGAAMVFGPAQMCFNAVSFLINTAQKYEKIFSGLGDLFETIFSFLDRFEVYARPKAVGVKLDNHLKSIIHELLQTFVSICALSSKLASTKGRIMAALSTFAFGSDQGVSAALAKLQSLVDQETRMTMALTLEEAQNSGARTAAGLTELKVSVQNADNKLDSVNHTASLTLETVQSSEVRMTSGLSEIKLAVRNADAKMSEALETMQQHEAKTTVGFSQLNVFAKNMDGKLEALDNAEKRKEQESFMEKNRKKAKSILKIGEETWREHRDELLRSAVANTGSWLLEDKKFIAWKANEETDGTRPALALEAGKGFGKSILCAKVTEYLKEAYKDRSQTEHISVAYFFFQEDRNSNDENLSMNAALRKIIWQLSESDPVYQKFVAGICERSDSFTSNTIYLWEKAIMDYSKTKATFFIILDGIDKAKKEPGKMQPLARMLQDVATISKDSNPLLRVRLFLTGQKSHLEDLETESSMTIPKFTLGQANRDDILRFIDDRVDQMPTVRNLDSLRSLIREKLLESAQGDYQKMAPILDEISKARRRNEIEATLARADEDPQEALRRQIEELNNSLDQQDIEDLNELLMWYFVGNRWYSVQEMETVLYLKNLASREDSLVTLAEQIREKYSTLLYVDADGDVMPTSTLRYIKDLQSEQEETGADDDDADSETDSTKLHASEVAIVRRFLRQVCDDELFAKFGFDEFFVRKLGKKPTKIDLRPRNGHVRILLTNLRAFCGENREEAKPLHGYAVWSLASYLDQVDLAHAENGTKREVGVLLLRLFTDEECIRDWWTEQRLSGRDWAFWLYLDEDVDSVLRWLKDSVVTEALSDEDKRWVNDLCSNSKPDEDLLKPITRIMATDWLQSSKMPLENFFYWVYAVMTKIESRKGSVERAKYDMEFPEMTADMIYAAEAWVMKLLEVDEPDVQWTVRVASTLSHFSHQDEAIKKGDIARAMDPDNWMVDLLFMRIHQCQEDFDACLKTALALADRFRANERLQNEFESVWKQVLVAIGYAYHHLGQHEASTQAYWQLFDDFPDEYASIVTMMEHLEERGDFEGVIALLEELDTRQPKKQKKQDDSDEEPDDSGSSLTQLTALYHAFARNDSYHYRVAHAARATDSMAVVRKAFRNAADAAEAPLHPSLLSYWQATAYTADEKQRLRLETLGFLRYHYALTLFHHGDGSAADAREAVALLELNVFAAAAPASATTWVARWAARPLAGLYMHLAKDAGLGSPAAQRWCEQLRKLVDARARSADAGGGPVEINLVLGRLHHLSGREKEAREALAAHVRLCLDLLDDDDPDNDWQAYLTLAVALAPLDDDANALAAWCLIKPEVRIVVDSESEGGGEGADEVGEDGEEESEESEGAEGKAGSRGESEKTKDETNGAETPDGQDETDAGETEAKDTGLDQTNGSSTDSAVDGLPTSSAESTQDDAQPRREAGTPPPGEAAGEEAKPKRVDGPLANFCDGGCDKWWRFADDLYVCKDCLDIQFCASCVEKLRAGTLERQVCGRGHAFLHVPPWEEIERANEAAGVGEGQVLVGEEVLAVEEWVRRIRARWGFGAKE